jgi:hypothetical protein
LSALAGTEKKVDSSFIKPHLAKNLFSEGGTDEEMGFEASCNKHYLL